MPYDPSDLRTALATKPAPSAGTGANIPAQYFEFGDLPPDDTSVSGATTWWTRSQSIVVAFTKADSGAVLERSGQPDEYVVLVVDPGSSVEAIAGDDRVTVSRLDALGIEIDVIANDNDPDASPSDPNPLTLVSFEEDGLHGRISQEGTKLRYKPHGRSYGNDGFTYVIEDKKHARTTGLVFVKVLPDAPPTVTITGSTGPAGVEVPSLPSTPAAKVWPSPVA
jgi:hypothetical protein